MANRQITELEFSKIKASLIEAYKNDPTFTDYNFEGSALNLLMDVLAYNTHYLGYYANMLHNEGFVDTAQKRSSLVSRAKELGYVPKSSIASTAIIDMRMEGIGANIQPALQRGTIVSSSNGNGQFNFVVVNDVEISREDDGDFYRNVELKEGRILSNFFVVDRSNNSRLIYTIPNPDVDVTSLRVVIRDSIGSFNVREYFLASDPTNLKSDSEVYFLQESYDELFQIYFGDDILGKTPEDGNVIEISYVIGAGEVANGCTFFNVDPVGFATDASFSLVQQSIGGSAKESVETLRESVVKSFAAQNRAVTQDDYVSIIRRKLPLIKNVKVWGGEKNLPPVYGKVFISVQTDDLQPLSERAKTEVVIPEVTKFNVLTIIPEVIDPKVTRVGLVIDVKFNRNKTSLSKAGIVDVINQEIEKYFDEEVTTFDKEFLESRLSSRILSLSESISSVKIESFCSFIINPVLGRKTNITLTENNKIKRGSVESSLFKVFSGGVLVSAKIVDNPNKIESRLDRLNGERFYGKLELVTADGSLISEIGEVEYNSGISETSGTFNFDVTIAELISQNPPSVYYKTEDEDISVARNQILLLDTSQKNPATLQRNGIQLNIVAYEK